MAPWILQVALLAAFAGGQAKKDDNPVDRVQAKICAALAKLEPSPADKERAEEVLRQELYQIVDTDIARLRPAKGSKTYISQDKAFVLVIGANGTEGADGQNVVDVIDTKALLVMAVAGDGGPGQGNTRPGFGGLARARALSGIAIALGGRGGLGGGAVGAAGQTEPSAQSVWAEMAVRVSVVVKEVGAVAGELRTPRPSCRR